jgi:hypothetical protein
MYDEDHFDDNLVGDIGLTTFSLRRPVRSLNLSAIERISSCSLENKIKNDSCVCICIFAIQVWDVYLKSSSCTSKSKWLDSHLPILNHRKCPPKTIILIITSKNLCLLIKSEKKPSKVKELLVRLFKART